MPVGAREQAPVVREAVAGGVDGLVRLPVVLRPPARGREVREVGDDEVELVRHGVEEVAAGDADASGDAVPRGVRPRERDGADARVRRPDLAGRRAHGERDRDRAGPRPDVGDARGAAPDAGERGVDERLRRRARRHDDARVEGEVEAVEGRLHALPTLPYCAPVTADPQSHVERAQARYAEGEARLAEARDADARQRQLTRLANAAWGAGLALALLGRREEAVEWLDRAAARYRESWDDAPPESWGRLIALLKCRILAGDWAGAERAAAFALEQRPADAASPIGRYAAALALLVLGRDADARPLASSIRERDDFPRDVADAVALLAAEDVVGYADAIESALDSFAARGEFLEDVPVADTVLVLQALAQRRGFPAQLDSPLLPR